MPEDAEKVKRDLQQAKENKENIKIKSKTIKNLQKEVRVKDQTIKNLQKDVRVLQEKLDIHKDKEKIELKIERAIEDTAIRREIISDLNKLDEKIMELERQRDILLKERPKLKPDNLMASFKAALVKMQEGLKVGEGRVDYVISKFDTDLKVNVTLDDEGISYQFPKFEDVIPSENLSTIRFSIKTVPKPTPPLPEMVEVPNLLGMPKDVAKDSIIAAKFTEGDITERISSTAPGTVIEQNPDPYSKAQIGTPLDLVISKVTEVKVPNFIGMDKDNAIDVIESAKLTVGKITEEISVSAPGTVISQGITADTLVPVGTSVDLEIAKAETVTVPKVVGKGIEDARKIVETAKLMVGKITEKTSKELKGTVIEQSPEAGKEVPVETSINLVIAKPEMVKVPNVIGKKKEEAIKTIESAKLKVGKISERESRKAVDTVFEQRPEAGKEVSIGTSIDLLIAKPKTVTVPEVTDMPRELAVKTLEEARIKVGRTIEIMSRKPKGMIIRQSPSPGEKVHAGASITLTISRGWRLALASSTIASVLSL